MEPSSTGSVDRWPAIEASLLDLLSECSQIVEVGRDAFEQPRSLTYRVAEAVIIHFDDLLGRLPADRAARKDVVWDVIEQRVPQVIVALVG